MANEIDMMASSFGTWKTFLRTLEIGFCENINQKCAKLVKKPTTSKKNSACTMNNKTYLLHSLNRKPAFLNVPCQNREKTKFREREFQSQAPRSASPMRWQNRATPSLNVIIFSRPKMKRNALSRDSNLWLHLLPE